MENKSVSVNFASNSIILAVCSGACSCLLTQLFLSTGLRFIYCVVELLWSTKYYYFLKFY